MKLTATNEELILSSLAFYESGDLGYECDRWIRSFEKIVSR